MTPDEAVAKIREVASRADLEDPWEKLRQIQAILKEVQG